MSEKIFGVHAQALNLRAQRAGLLAANLANADTPGFKARDVDFKSVLGAQNRAMGVSMTTTDPQHQRRGGIAGFDDVTLKYRVPLQPSLDGNTVDEQVEKGEFSSNAVRYMASLKFLENRVSGIVRALRGE